jgi:predicted Rossmann-fold nucleotide-binding protein
MRFKVLVCGGRNWNERKPIRDALNELLREHGNLFVITGGAPGADTQAATAAAELSVHAAVVKPLWSAFGKGAGHLRNRAMLDLEPDLVIAFPGGRGTANMIEQAHAAHVPVWEPLAETPSPSSLTDE